MNGGDNKMAGELGFANFIANPDAKQSTPNIWIWALAMSNFSKDKDATWYFMQWASGLEHALFGAVEMDFVDPVRQTVWKDEAFRDKLKNKYQGFVDMFDAAAPGASIKFTAQPLFFDVTTEWAATLQKMVANEVPVDEGLDKLAESIDRQFKEAGLG
jgi:multiple sugar transport system substrate-binding protein